MPATCWSHGRHGAAGLLAFERAHARALARAFEPHGLPLGRSREQRPGTQTRGLPALGRRT
eukprot:5895357-Prymnesium_polylepis.1